MVKRWIAGALFLLFVQANSGLADLLVVVANVGQSKVPVGGQGGANPTPPVIMPPIGPGGGFGGPEMPMEEEVASKIISVVVDVEPGQGPLNVNTYKQFNDGVSILYAKTRWGVAPLVSKNVMAQKGEVHAMAEFPANTDGKKLLKFYPPPAKLYTEESTALALKKDATIDDSLELAEKALALGLIDRFTEVMNKYAGSDKDKNHPSVATFAKVHLALTEKTFKEPSGDVPVRLRESGKYKVENSKYYQVYHNLTPAEALEARGRLDRLDKAYRTVYYWFALRGVELPLPEEKLLAILTSSEEDHKQLNQLLGRPAVVVDSFHVRRENLSVFSTRRTDRAYEALDRFATSAYFTEKYSRADLAKAKVGVVPKGGYEEQQAITFALMLKAMDAEGEVASSSHQNARQLLFASGLLPKNVHIPEWVQFGFGSFFETPLEAPQGSAGRISSLHLPIFRELQRAPTDKDRYKYVTDRLEPTLSSATLRGIVTDTYFRQAAVVEGKAQPAYLAKARATSWALMYFLLRLERDATMRYLKELSKLPRDMELDEEQLWVCFARAFDAFDAKTGTINTGKLNQLARKWNDDLRAAKLDGKEILDKVAEARKDVEKIAAGQYQVPMQPGQPGQPGVPPGGGR